MNVSAWSIRNPIAAALCFVLLTFGGLLAFHQMKVQHFPDIELPVVLISAQLPGAAPEQLENEVARKLEDAIATLQGLRRIISRLQDGTVTISVEFQLERPVQEAVDDVRSAIERIRADLPAELRGPMVSKLEMAGQPILAFTVTSPQRDIEALSWFVDHEVTRGLLAQAGVGGVQRVGGVDREIRVALDPLRLRAWGVTAAEVSQGLKRVLADAAGGRMELGESEQALRVWAAARSAEDVAAAQLPLADGRRLPLGELATVTDTVATPRAAALLDGVPAVAFEVSRSRGASEIEVGRAVREALASLGERHPDLSFTEAFNFVDPVRNEYDSSLRMLYEGALLAVAVVWLFLRDWRATLVSAVALPLSVIPAFLGMAMLGFSINLVTLLALSLVIGILVDDAIVEVENIVRHLRMGKTPYQAAMEAADEIGLAVIATTFTLIAVFLPTAFMSGIAGRFFQQFGWTAALAVFASLVVARMLTPMMSAYMLKPMTRQAREPGWMPGYLRMVEASLRHRGWTVLAAALFFAGSLALASLIGTEFIPPDDNSQTQVGLSLPPGATLAQTLAVAEQARDKLAGIGEVTRVYTAVGAGSASAAMDGSQRATEVRQARLTLGLVPRGERPRKQRLEARIREALADLPGTRVTVGLGGWGERYQLVLAGDDPAALAAAARAVERDLRTLDGLGSITSSASLQRPEIVVTPDPARAADLGVSSQALADTLRVATLGDYPQWLPKLNLAQRQVPIVVQLDERARADLDVLARLAVPSSHPQRGTVELADVAQLSLGGGPAGIDRYGRLRNISFDIELAGTSLGEAKAAVLALPSLRALPPGVQVIELGDADLFQELSESFGLAMLTGVLCIYVVLVLLFKDFLQPVTILCALPLSLGGAFVAMLLAGHSLSMPSFIGLVMLMGIATKNSILLVEYAIAASRDRGLARQAALVDACHKRARPIVMTSLAMGAGMLPLALGLGGSDPSFRAPMALAVIGGLVTSTFLSLLVVPSAYTYVDDCAQAWRRWRGGR